MKKQSNILFTSLKKAGLQNLTVEVKETIAFGITATAEKIFTVAELWNIQRNAKKRVGRRYL